MPEPSGEGEEPTTTALHKPTENSERIISTTPAPTTVELDISQIHGERLLPRHNAPKEKN